ncbi:hypothetical protein COSO111634_08055 [Corallococcus soli]
MARKSCPSTSPIAYTRAMFGCASRTTTRASSRKRPTNCRFSKSPGSTFFTTTARRTPSSRARKTSPIPPAPMRRTSV